MNKQRTSQGSSKSRSLLRDRSGAVYVEFLLAFVPLFFLFLGMVQMGLLYACDLVVRHAAVTATRAAVVVIDDNPTRYDGDGRLRFETNGSASRTAIRTVIETILRSSSTSGSSANIDSARYSAIHSAASLPLLPFAPAANMIWSRPNDENVMRAIGTMPEGRAAFGMLYNEVALTVTFPTAPTARDYRTEWERPNSEGVVENGGQVTARVTYLFHCAVPLANRLMCDDLFALMYGVDIGRVGGIAAAFARGDISWTDYQAEMAALRRSNERLEEWRPRTDELHGVGGGAGIDLFGAMAGISSLFGGPAPRFLPIQREATMPLQAANYCYRDESGGHTPHDSGAGCWNQELD